MNRFKPGDLIVVPSVKHPRFGTPGWGGKVDRILGEEDGETVYGVSLWAYGASYTYRIRESYLKPSEAYMPLA